QVSRDIWPKKQSKRLLGDDRKRIVIVNWSDREELLHVLITSSNKKSRGSWR
ncbi:5562_t:CDS:1, partial [Paraglomus occultum]